MRKIIWAVVICTSSYVNAESFIDTIKFAESKCLSYVTSHSVSNVQFMKCSNSVPLATSLDLSLLSEEIYRLRVQTDDRFRQLDISSVNNRISDMVEIKQRVLEEVLNDPEMLKAIAQKIKELK